MDRRRVLLLVFLTVSGTALQGDEVSASATQNCYASSSATTSCLVNYESSLTLHCPNTTTNSSSHGEWWKQNPTTGRTQGVCYDRNCTLYEPLHNEDTAVYFCQMSDRKYYVNVTVLEIGTRRGSQNNLKPGFLHPTPYGYLNFLWNQVSGDLCTPPSIVCDPEFCTCYETSKTCRQPLISKVWDDDVQLTTNFSGQGPLSVVWEHRGRVLNCSAESSDDIKCTITRGKASTYQYETLTLPGPLETDWYNGTYIANVSNPYGYNMTKQYVEIICPTVEPPKTAGNRTTSLTKGETRHVTLTTRGSRQFYMWVCFTTDPSIDMWNIQLNSSCVKCKDKSCDSHGIPNRPHWTVDRSETGCSGDSIIDLSVLVKDFSKRDTGRLLLTWSTDSSEQGPQQHNVLTVTSLRYKESLSEYVYAGIGVGGGCVVLGVSMVAVVIGRFWYKRKKMAAQRARRRAERRHAARNGGGRGEEEASDDDNDREHLVGGGNRGYGAIPRHGHGINRDTAPSEIENEVVLQTDSEGTTRDV